MPVHIDKMTSEVGVLDGELPLNESQIDRLTQIIMDRLEHRRRESELASEENGFRSSMAPSVQTID